MDKIDPNLLTQARFKALVRSGFPFNPVSGEEISGQNLYRLQQAMMLFKWNDPRFVTQEEAEKGGWIINDGQPRVTIHVRDPEYGMVKDVQLINGSSLQQMPSLETMQNMNNEELKAIQEKGNIPVQEANFGEDEISIIPSRELTLMDPEKQSVADQDVADTGEPGREDVFMIVADYWRAGLHNTKGVVLATKLNEEIRKNKLTHDKAAVTKLIETSPDAKRLGLKLVTEHEHKKNRHYKLNIAEPESLNNGMYMRDRHGAYRPAGGGRVVIEDNADSIKIKSKSKESYKAAIELAVAKGWTSIELKGSKKLMPDIWLEAKLKGLDVIGYKPSEKDIEKYNKRLDELSAETAKDLRKNKLVYEKPIEQEPVQEQPQESEMDKEKLESDKRVTTMPISPLIEQPIPETSSMSVVDTEGRIHEVKVVYEVRYNLSDIQVEKFDNPKDAANSFVKQPDFTMPVVMRVTSSVDGNSHEDMLARTVESNGRFKREIKPEYDMAFNEFAEEALVREHIIPQVHHKSKEFSGLIVEVDHKNGTFKQKTGRLHSDITTHSMEKLGYEIKKDQYLNIAYDDQGIVSKCKEIEREQAIGLSR